MKIFWVYWQVTLLDGTSEDGEMQATALLPSEAAGIVHEIISKRYRNALIYTEAAA